MAYRAGKGVMVMAFKYLLDTDVIIWHLRGHEPTEKILKAIEIDQPIGCSVISVFETLAGIRERELASTSQFLAPLYKIPIDGNIAIKAAEYWREFRAKGITIGQADAMIAATANILKLTLITYNRRYYPMDDIVFYENAFM
jgi:predicted nucleic acid-binding protein